MRTAERGQGPGSATRAAQAPELPGPRLAAGTKVAHLDGKVVFLGPGVSKQVGGPNAVNVMLPVARLLDGSRDVARVAAETGFPDAVVRKVCLVLSEHGLLHEDAARPAVADDSAAESRVEPDDRSAAARPDGAELARAYLSGYLEAGPQSDQVEHCVGRLAGATVAVCAPEPVGSRVAADLAALGLGRIVLAQQNTAEDGPAAEELPQRVTDLAIAVVMRDPRAPEAVDGLVRRLRERGFTVLTFGVDENALALGPTFVPRADGCHTCYRTSEAALFGSAGSPGPAAVHQYADLIAGLVGDEVFVLAGGHAEAATLSAVVRHELPGLAAGRFLLAPEPDCPDCAAAGDPYVTVLEYQQRARGAQRPQPTSVRRRQNLLVQELRDQRPPYPHHPEYPLPRPAGPDHCQAGRLTPDTVGFLLALAAGRRGDAVRGPRSRWAPTGGQLGSVELFAVFDGGFADRPAGTVLRYDDLAHRLVTATARTATCFEPAGLAGAPSAPETAGALRLFLVGNTGRLAKKYQAFALRLAYLDAGCALTQLFLAADLLGLAIKVQSDWPGETRSMLELLDGAELLTASVLISAPNRAADSGEASRHVGR